MMNGKPTKRPNLPPSSDPRFPDAVREIVQGILGERGDKIDRAVTFRDLLDTGIASMAGSLVQRGANDDPRNYITPPDQPDLSVPPPVKNLKAMGGFRSVMLTWDNPRYNGHAYSEIHRGTSADFGQSVLIGWTPSYGYTDTVGSDQRLSYWARHVSDTGLKGPWSGPVNAVTAADPQYIADQIQGMVDESTLAANLTSRIDLIDAPTTGLVDRIGVSEARIVDIKNVVQNDGTTLAQKFIEIASSANAVFSQPDEPAAIDSAEGDLWIDTDDQNRLRTYVNGVWVDALVGGVETALQAAADAQETADGKIQSFWQPTEPANSLSNDLGIGDIWFDTDDQNRPYRWSGTIWEDARDSKIADAIDAASTAQTTANGKVTTFYQDTPPAAEGDGDLWVNIGDENRLLRWDAGLAQWVNIRDGAVQRALDTAAESLAAADGEIVAYYQATAPAGSTVELGDLWFDTSANNAPFRWDGSAWVDASNNAVAKALYDLIQVQATVDGKATTFFQPTAPTAEGDGDLWVDTGNNNILHRWDAQAGQWDEVRDLGISVGLGKTKAFYQTAEPQAENVGDLWFDTDDGDKAYRWDGLTWSPMGLATVEAVDAKVVENNVTMIGYCSIGGTPNSQYTTPASCSAAGGSWVPAAPLAESVKQVSVTDGNQVAALEQMFQAHGSDIGDLKLQYTLKLDNDGYVSGLGLFNDGTTSEFIVASDAVYFIDAAQSIETFNPAANYPSIDAVRDTQLVFGYANVEGHRRFVINVPAFIPDATITSAKVEVGFFEELTVLQKATIKDLVVNATASIWDLNIQNLIQSDDWISSGGTAGWEITQEGEATFLDGTFRGRIEADTGYIASSLQVSGTSRTLAEINTLTTEAKNVADAANDTAVGAEQAANAAQNIIDNWKKPDTTLINGNQIFTGDAYVDTLQIKGQAVTVPETFIATSSDGALTSTWSTVGSFSYNHGSPFAVRAVVMLAGYVSVGAIMGTVTSAEARIRVLRDGNVVGTTQFVGVVEGAYVSDMWVISSLPSGNNPFTVQVSGSVVGQDASEGSFIGTSSERATVFVMGAKR